MTNDVSAREKLEATVIEYRHVQSGHRGAGVEGSARRHLHARLAQLESRLERLLDQSVADEAARQAWRRRLHEASPAPADPQQPEPALLFKGRSAAGSVIEVRRRPVGDLDVLVDGTRLERVAAAADLVAGEFPLSIGGQTFEEIFEAPGPAVAAARAYFSDPSVEPPWQHAPALAADGLIDGTFALTTRGRRAIAAGRTRP